jgi:hypothetical protein
MGVVYLGVDGDETCAVKVIRPEFADDPVFRARFRREIAAARRVASPYVARVIEADAEADLPWMASEVVDGPSLEEFVRGHGVLDADAQLGLAIALAQGLQAIHQGGVVHRDLKPSNVLLGPNGPRIVDFGVAHAASMTQITTTGVILGSPAFMAPEQATGQPTAAASDVFSLASVIAFAACGCGPFGTGTGADVLYRVVHEAPRLPSLPDPLGALVRASLDKDPTTRPTTGAWISTLTSETDPESTLAAFAAATTTAASPQTLIRPELGAGASQSRRPRALAEYLFIGAAVAVIAVAVIVFLLAMHSSNAPTHAAAPSVRGVSAGPGGTSHVHKTQPATAVPRATTSNTVRSTSHRVAATTTTVALPAPPAPQLAFLDGPVGQQRAGASDWLDPQTLLNADPNCLGCVVAARADNLPGPNGPTTVALLHNHSTNTVVAVSADGVARLKIPVGGYAGSDITIDKQDIILDKSGNVLFNFFIPDHSGQVLVVRVTPQGITDLSSMRRFAVGRGAATLRTVPGDPYTEIGININTCDPDCAAGNVATTWFKWTGTDYSPS